MIHAIAHHQHSMVSQLKGSEAPGEASVVVDAPLVVREVWQHLKAHCQRAVLIQVQTHQRLIASEKHRQNLQ